MLLGDHIVPNRLVRNKYYKPTKGVGQRLITDERVYPLHVTSVNRGYAPGILDKDSMLVDVTAACGPLVYRGGIFPDGYDQNVFVCVPEVNLIKRNVLSFHGDSISAKQAWQGKEFLASRDEGFRPVNLSNGPDGNMYVVDMHRGVIQHYAFLSPYLKKESEKKKLDTIQDYGRILKVSSRDKTSSKIPDFEQLSTKQWVRLLKDKNGWVRDRAQQAIIFNKMLDAIPYLEVLAIDVAYPRAQIHTLYALKGLNALAFTKLIEIAAASSADVSATALVLLENYVSKKNALPAKRLFEDLLAKK